MLRVRRILFVAVLGLVVFSGVVFSLPVHAAEIRILKVAVARLVLWKTPDAQEIVVMIDPARVPSNLYVDEIAGNGMLKVTVDGHTGYVMRAHVETDEKIDVQVMCGSSSRVNSVSGLRGIGEGCK